MDTLIKQEVAAAPEHPVLPHAGKYDVHDLRFRWTIGTDNAILEIEASTHVDYAILRFEGIEDLCIPCGDLITSIKLHIQDTSQCPSQWSHHVPPVRVGGTSTEGYGLQFWAQSVKRLSGNEAMDFSAGN